MKKKKINKHKVVYNACYGGFNLSDKAFKLYKEYGGKGNFTYYIPERHENALVRVVEELGNEASRQPCSDLRIEEIIGNMYFIYEHDGKETVVTPEKQMLKYTVIEE